VGEVELAGSRTHDPHRGRDEREVGQADVPAQERAGYETHLHLRYLEEGLRALALGKPQVSDGQPAREGVETNAFDGGCTTRAGGDLGNRESPNQRGECPQHAAPHDHHAQAENEHEPEQAPAVHCIRRQAAGDAVARSAARRLMCIVSVTVSSRTSSRTRSRAASTSTPAASSGFSVFGRTKRNASVRPTSQAKRSVRVSSAEFTSPPIRRSSRAGALRRSAFSSMGRNSNRLAAPAPVTIGLSINTSRSTVIVTGKNPTTQRSCPLVTRRMPSPALSSRC